MLAQQLANFLRLAESFFALGAVGQVFLEGLPELLRNKRLPTAEKRSLDIKTVHGHSRGCAGRPAETLGQAEADRPRMKHGYSNGSGR